MAVTAATGGSGTVDTTGGTIFNVTGDDFPQQKVTSIQVWADDNNTNALRIEVDGIHASGEGLYLDPGKTSVLRLGDNALAKITVKANTGTETVHWGVVATQTARF
jgi:archaellum component FlaG (FlaF/FlaG flagellin family)